MSPASLILLSENGAGLTPPPLSVNIYIYIDQPTRLRASSGKVAPAHSGGPGGVWPAQPSQSVLPTDTRTPPRCHQGGAPPARPPGRPHWPGPSHPLQAIGRWLATGGAAGHTHTRTHTHTHTHTHAHARTHTAHTHAHAHTDDGYLGCGGPPCSSSLTGLDHPLQSSAGPSLCIQWGHRGQSTAAAAAAAAHLTDGT